MPDSPEKQYSVAELTHFIKFLLENNENLSQLYVRGEVSNLTKHSSGHVYFTLKDDGAQLTSVMFRGVASRYKTLPKNGEEVVLQGDINVYPPRGNYQLIVRKMVRSGVGELHLRFMEMKEALEVEGLFDSAHKKPIPRFPKKIGVITSPTGAAIRDIHNTLRRRFPHTEVLLSPTVVQGDNGVASILHSFKKLEKVGGIEVIILARGGGSIEDLWNFNEEQVARAIYDCEIPIISGIGHETDFTIADFVSDLRASTPTAAAELAVPEVREIHGMLDTAAQQMRSQLQYFVDYRRQMVDDLEHRLESGMLGLIDGHRDEVNLLKVQIENMDVHKVLDRGYSITLHNRKPVLSWKSLKKGDKIETMLSDGKTSSIIEESIKNEE